MPLLLSDECSTDAKNQLTGKDPDAGKGWRQEEKGATEDEMVGWHHKLNEREFEQTPGDSAGQRSLACCGPLAWKGVRYDLVTEQLQALKKYLSWLLK